MKILVLTDLFPPVKGGVSRYTYEIVKGLNKFGLHVDVDTTVSPVHSKKKMTKFERFKINYIKKNRMTYFHSFLAFRHFLRNFNRGGYTLAFFTLWNPYSIFMYILKWIRPKKYRYIVACHGADVLALYPNSSFPVKKIFKKLGKKAVQEAYEIFTVSNFTANEIKKLGVDPQKIKVFPNGVDLDVFRPEKVDTQSILKRYDIPNPQLPVLLTVAQLNIRKGVDTCIQVVDQLRTQGVSVNYIVIGSGSDEERLRKLIGHHCLEDQVFLLTSIDDKELLKFYNLCDIFMLLSRYEGDYNVEGFGIAFIEANACGKPVIGGNTGGIPDAIENGRSGFIVEPTNVTVIAGKIIFLLNHPEQMEMMGCYGRKIVKEKFNWEKITFDMSVELNHLVKNW